MHQVAEHRKTSCLFQNVTCTKQVKRQSSP